MPQPDFRGLHIKENVRLAGYTTLRLGGEARFFAECRAVPEILSALQFARRNGIRLHVLGGGSNTIFRDEGFDGLVLKIALTGKQFLRGPDHVKFSAAAGEQWDGFVQFCIRQDLAGVECLSGIPGLVGATPIQNVGAYGQEVAETIVEVKAIDRTTMNEVRFTNPDCRFAYRMSRFNSEDADRFLITEVCFLLKESGEPTLRYPELKKFIDARVDLKILKPGFERLQAVRDAVLQLRKMKSMVIDPDDPDSRSVGSFFKNPVLSQREFALFEGKVNNQNIGTAVPAYPSGENIKIPAAWLVENAGFRKGYRMKGVGVSSNHSLALVNLGGTSAELLAFAGEIQSAVFKKFGIHLEREPVVVQ